MKVVLITGGFDPLHSGHIAYIKAARSLGNLLVIGVNSDAWLERKKGRAFMPFTERSEIIKNLYQVHRVIEFNDDDGTAKDAIVQVRKMFPMDEIIFANGGDRTADNIPEMDIKDNNLIFKFGVGGEDKKNSSSWILEEWKSPKVERPWGYYRVIYQSEYTKVKELVVQPGKSLSMQKHKWRNEHWHVADGQCVVESQMPGGYKLPSKILGLNQTVDIGLEEWHKLTNPYAKPCKIIEIQYGTYCEEDDIERKP
jgi:cytidyltransferase-like protein